MKKNPWITVKRKIVYESPYLRVREDEVIRPDGKKGIYNVVSKGRSNVIIPVSDSGEFYLVGQWRYPISRYSWELPGGKTEGGETLIQTGKRELWEETHLVAKNWRNLGWLDLLSGVSDDIFDILVAEGVSLEKSEEVDADCINQIKAVSFKKLLEMLGKEIRNAQSLAALFLYLRDSETRKKFFK